MAWTIPTYAGTYMGGSPSNARTAMFELMRGVNERQGALGLTKTEFFKSDGSESADLSISDLINIRTTGVDSYSFLNLKRIRDAIIDLVNGGYFTETSGQSAILTKASLETAISGDLDPDPIRPQEARFWQVMQDALDRLIYAYGTFQFLPSTDTKNGTQSNTESTLAAAWTGRADNTLTASLFKNKCFLWYTTTSGANNKAYVVDSSDLIYKFDEFIPAGYLSGNPAVQVYGVIAESWAQLNSITLLGSGNTFNSPSATVDFVVDGVSQTKAFNDTTSYYTQISSPSITADFTITIDAEAAPGTWVAATAGLYGWSVYLIHTYIDLATVLTDQS